MVYITSDIKEPCRVPWHWSYRMPGCMACARERAIEAGDLVEAKDEPPARQILEQTLTPFQLDKWKPVLSQHTFRDIDTNNVTFQLQLDWEES